MWNYRERGWDTASELVDGQQCLPKDKLLCATKFF